MIAKKKDSIVEKRNQELLDLRKKTGEILTAEDVVTFAQNKKTALHSAFEWDNDKAAHEFRLAKARQLIVQVVVIPQGCDRPIKANVSLVRDRINPEGGYRETVAVLNDEEMREEMVQQAFQDFKWWQGKYEHLMELVPIIVAAKKVMKTQTKPKGKRKNKKSSVAV